MLDPISATLAGASLIGGIAGSRSSKKLAKEQLALQREMFKFQRQRYLDYKEKYGGLEDQMVADAKKGVIADLEGVTNRASTDVATQFANAEDARLRNMQRMGINPNSGRADAMAARNSVAQSLAAAGNITTGREAERRNADNQTWARRSAVTDLGVRQMNGAAQDMNSAQDRIASTYGNMANNAASQAGALYGAAGSLIGNGAFDGIFSGRSATTPTTAPVAGISRPEYLPVTPTAGQRASSLVGDLNGGRIPGLSSLGF